MNRPHLTILGMPGSGKTTVGSIVAERAGLPLLDGDTGLATTIGRSARDIATDDGVVTLHRLEQQVARELLSSEEPSVVAPAASALDDADTMAVVRSRSWLVVVLDLDPAIALGRTKGDHRRRPMEPDEARSRWADRRAIAVSNADVVLDATQIPAELAERISQVRAC